jgi:uncharacterized coiled-coil DUF342 family protein
MEDQIRNRIKELVAQRDQILGQINQNTTQRQQLEAAYQQTAGCMSSRRRRKPRRPSWNWPRRRTEHPYYCAWPMR